MKSDLYLAESLDGKLRNLLEKHGIKVINDEEHDVSYVGEHAEFVADYSPIFRSHEPSIILDGNSVDVNGISYKFDFSLSEDSIERIATRVKCDLAKAELKRKQKTA